MLRATSSGILLVSFAPMLVLADAIGMLDWFFNEDSRSEFARDTAVALVAVVIGIPAGLWLNRYTQRRSERERRLQLLRALRRALNLNIDRLRDMFDYSANELGGLPTFAVTLGVLDSTNHHRHELLSIKTAGAIDHAHYELQHVQRRLDKLIEQRDAMNRGANDRVPPVSEDYRLELIDQLESHYETVALADKVGSLQILPYPLYEFLRNKSGFFALAIGLTEREPDAPMTPNHFDGAAIKHCRNAVASIENDIARMGEPIETSDDIESNSSGSSGEQA